MTGTTAATDHMHTHDHDDEYDTFVRVMEQEFKSLVGDPNTKLYTTDTDVLFTSGTNTLYDVYLEAFGGAERQVHTCATCRQFIERFGGLVTIDEQGLTRSVMWNYVPEGFYGAPIRAMQRRVRQSKVTGVFVSDEKRWGIPKTGAWSHYAVTPPKHLVYTGRAKSAYEAMAEKKEDFKNMQRVLREFNPQMIDMAVTLLESEALYRSEKVLGPVKWLQQIRAGRGQTGLRMTKDERRMLEDNLLWRAVALAPAGFAHPRSSMAGSLLEDIAARLPLDDVKRKFAAKMHPLQYQRPQAAPAAGTIAQAEKLVEKLGIAASLKRRFARIDELTKIWFPPIREVCSEPGVFGHLKPKGADALKTMQSTTATPITFSLFQRTVLPFAEKIQLLLPVTGNFGAFVSAEDMDAPPIIQWDHPERRNPVTWYVYHGGTAPGKWHLPRSGTWVDVTCLSLQPNMWQPGFEHHGEGVMFVLDGAQEDRGTGTSLFPEFLKAELHDVRSVIEAHSKQDLLGGRLEASACGLMIQKTTASSHAPTRVRVAQKGVSLDYLIDRWE